MRRRLRAEWAWFVRRVAKRLNTHAEHIEPVKLSMPARPAPPTAEQITRRQAIDSAVSKMRSAKRRDSERFFRK